MHPENMNGFLRDCNQLISFSLSIFVRAANKMLRLWQGTPDDIVAMQPKKIS